MSKRTQPWYLRLQKLAVVLVSTVFLFGTAPSFFVLWGSWRFLSIFLTDRWYQIGDDFLYSLYQRLVLFFYQHFAKIKVRLQHNLSTEWILNLPSPTSFGCQPIISYNVSALGSYRASLFSIISESQPPISRPAVLGFNLHLPFPAAPPLTLVYFVHSLS